MMVRTDEQLGDVAARLIERIGIKRAWEWWHRHKPCDGCARRRAMLNRLHWRLVRCARTAR